MLYLEGQKVKGPVKTGIHEMPPTRYF